MASTVSLIFHRILICDHFSNETIPDPVFVNHVLRHIIVRYDIRNQDLWIQSDNAPTECKNENAFASPKAH